MKNITVHELISRLQQNLELECKGGEHGSHRTIRSTSKKNPAQTSLIGHLNVIHPNQIQVLGPTELAYLEQLGNNSRHDIFQQLFSDIHTIMVIVAEGAAIPPEFMRLADTNNIPLFHCHVSTHEVITHFQYLMGSVLAETLVIHGVFMEVLGTGILLTGESGIGKSELALDLVSRGHRLIADDAPEFSKIAPDIINGTCPPLLKEFLEVRGLGILNVRSIFGDSAIRTSKYLRLIISLENLSDEQLRKIDRLRGNKKNRKVLGINIPEMTLPVAPGRNLAVAVETAVRNHSLLKKGYDAAEDFIHRQNNLVQKSLI